MDVAEEVHRKDATCSEVDASEATRGNTDSHNISNVIEIESSSTSTSHSTSVSTSSDIDNVPLNKIYESLQKTYHHLPSIRKILLMIHLCMCIPIFKKE